MKVQSEVPPVYCLSKSSYGQFYHVIYEDLKHGIYTDQNKQVQDKRLGVLDGLTDVAIDCRKAKLRLNLQKIQ
ncbi:hypothetical protein PoB_002777500, partial [Plakobranchus ocellatus]